MPLIALAACFRFLCGELVCMWYLAGSRNQSQSGNPGVLEVLDRSACSRYTCPMLPKHISQGANYAESSANKEHENVPE